MEGGEEEEEGQAAAGGAKVPRGGRVRVGGAESLKSSVAGFDDIEDPSSSKSKRGDLNDDDDDEDDDGFNRIDDDGDNERRMNKAPAPPSSTHHKGSTRTPLKPPSKAELRDLEAALVGPGGGGASISGPSLKSQPSRSKASAALPPSTPSAAAATASVHEAAKASTSSSLSFVPSAKFQGSKPGLVFKTGSRGLGYYPDPQQQQPATAATAGKGGKAVAASSQQPLVAVVAGGPASQPQSLNASQRHRLQRNGLGEGAADDAPPAPSSSRRDQRQASDDDEDEEEDEDQDQEGGVRGKEEGMRLASSNKAQAMKDLVSMAFAGDDVEAVFAAEKEQDVDGESLTRIPPSLPGHSSPPTPLLLPTPYPSLSLTLSFSYFFP